MTRARTLLVGTLVLALLSLGNPAIRSALAQTAIGNTAASLAGKFLVDREDDETITGLKTFSRSTSAPFAVNSGAAKVTNLNADLLDGLDWTTAPFWNVVTTTLTGTQNDLAGLTGNTVLHCNNASLLTITGFAGGTDGQHVIVDSTGAAQVDLAHQNTGSTTAADRLVNFATVGNTSLAAGTGVAEYVYTSTASRWRLVMHDQGAWITPAFSAGNFTGSASQTWTVASATVDKYLLRGRTLYLNLAILGTTGGTPSTQLLLAAATWGGYAINSQIATAVIAEDNSVAVLGRLDSVSSTQLRVFNSAAGTNWTAAASTGIIGGQIFFDVQ